MPVEPADCMRAGQWLTIDPATAMKTYEPPRQLRTCVSPDGRFTYGVHRPCFVSANLRQQDHHMELGRDQHNRRHLNQANFPAEDVALEQGDIVFEIPNPFPFRGTTYICKSWAEQSAQAPQMLRLPQRPGVSFHVAMEGEPADAPRRLLRQLPRPLLLALATTSTDPRDLETLAKISCRFIFDPDSGRPAGLCYLSTDRATVKADIHDLALFEAVANNPSLADDYKRVMVLNPGVQGSSEIVGDFNSDGTHVYEYLRRNSYIPWGHYAANMAQDAVRYDAGGLSHEDIQAMRHLYYQRTYVRLAETLDPARLPRRCRMEDETLENLRQRVLLALRQLQPDALAFSATLWGWNYGFDYAPSGYRLHASHQQIHQQFALIPQSVAAESGDDAATFGSYACGDLIQQFCRTYRNETGKSFFDCYLKAIRTNRRLDDREDKSADLVIFEDEQVLLFVPKAQTSQWELQLMPVAPVGNILEADTVVRRSLDRAMYVAMRVLAGLGARMVTVLEYSKRFYLHTSDQRLIYAFLPRLPESPGAFSEAQLRWINGHYPEDFAEACRLQREALKL